jgi:MobA/VirD2-like, nuclease domain
MTLRSICAGAFRESARVFRVIGKVLRGTNARGLLHYLYGPGRANEHTDPHLVTGFSDPAELEPERRPGGAPDLRRLAGLLAQPVAALGGRGGDKPVWHCSVRAAPEDRLLSDAEWAHVAAGVMHRTGLAPQGDDRGVRWVAVRHAPDHIHIVATLARQDGGKPSMWNDFYRVREACHDAERQFGLRSTAPADRTAARRATRAETEQTARRGWGETPRATLRREVCTAAAGAGTEQEFFARLEQAGVLVRLRYSTTSLGQVTGYAVGLARHIAVDGGVIWYGGGKLAADLTLPKLRARWRAPAGHDPLAGTELPASAVRAVLRNKITEAAQEARDEAGFFARLRESGVLVRVRFSETDPGQVTGYAVTLPGHSGPDGAMRWYGGGRLAAGLTLPQLRHRWGKGQNPVPERSATAWFTAPERDAIYGHASHQAAAAAEHIRRCVYSDPARAADAAWAAADTLHVAARALRNPALRRAADAYDRAARAPHGRIPRRSVDGDRLRATARFIASVGNLSGDATLLAAALVANLAALAAAVAELRRAQQHAAQAAAARSAAEHLHAAVAQARSRSPRPDQAQSAGQTWQRAERRVQVDLPVTLDPGVPVPSAQGVAHPCPHASRPLPPKRAGPSR